MAKTTAKKSTDFTDRIPTLTEIVAEPVLDLFPPLQAPTKPIAKTEPTLPKDLLQTIEQMVYKALSRQLAPLSKEISAEI
ncbi:MAG TPA: hypothetical protein VGL10_03805, partial [Gammaproteobacteria bacterium]